MIEFVDMTADLIPVVAEIDQRAFEFSWSEGDFRGSFESGHRFIVLKEDDRIVGFAVYMQVFEQAEVLTIGVEPDCRRRGFGSLLMEQMLAELMRSGAEKLFLEVRVSNTPAQGLYKKLGFEEISRRKGYYPSNDGREDAIVMQKDLLV